MAFILGNFLSRNICQLLNLRASICVVGYFSGFKISEFSVLSQLLEVIMYRIYVTVTEPFLCRIWLPLCCFTSLFAPVAAKK